MSEEQEKTENQLPETESQAGDLGTESQSGEILQEIERDFQKQIDELMGQLEEQKDKYLRLFADFDNYKKRMARERLELIDTAGRDVIQGLLPVLDDFDRALKNMDNSQDVQSLKEGILLISGKMNNYLQQKGLKTMSSIGQEFNPEQHEAITEIPAPNEEMKGKVMDEVEKGYLLGEKIIRYAKVVVGK